MSSTADVVRDLAALVRSEWFDLIGLSVGTEGLAGYGWSVPKLAAKPEARAIPSPIKDFYLTNAICRASPTMAQCTAELWPQAMPEAAE